jgi:hypothetical protein
VLVVEVDGAGPDVVVEEVVAADEAEVEVVEGVEVVEVAEILVVDVVAEEEAP